MLVACVSCQTYSVPGDFPDIQTALDGVPPFSTIVLADGTYHENLVWPETTGIVLKSESGLPERAVIDGSGAPESVVSLEATRDTDLVIEGITFRGGTGGFGLSDDSSIFSDLSRGLNPEVFSVAVGWPGVSETVSVLTEFQDKDPDSGGFTFGEDEGSGPLFRGGGIHLAVSEDTSVELHATIRTCIISGNTDGGLFFGHPEGVGSSSLLLEGSRIEGNSLSDPRGIGPVVITGGATLIQNEIRDNVGFGAAFFSDTPSYVFMTGNSILRNDHINTHGAGIWVVGEYTVDIRDNTLSDNTGGLISAGIMIGVPASFDRSSSINGDIEANDIHQTEMLYQPVVGIQIYDPESLDVTGNLIHHIQGEFGGFESGVGIVIGELFGDEPLPQASGNVHVTNNMIYRNDAGIVVNNALDGASWIINNTVVYNDFIGIGVLGELGETVLPMNPPYILNCIVGNWGSEDNFADLLGVTATYSNIADGDPGERNISADPKFVSLEKDDYRLQAASPCVNLGMDKKDDGGRHSGHIPDLDFEGDYRMDPDIGADEFVIE